MLRHVIVCAGIAAASNREMRADDPHVDVSGLHHEGWATVPRRHLARHTSAVEHHQEPVLVVSADEERRLGTHVERRAAHLEMRSVAVGDDP